MDEDSTKSGFQIHRPKPKKTLIKSRKSNGGYEMKSLRTKFDKLAVQHYNGPMETSLIRQKLCDEYWTRFMTDIKNLEFNWRETFLKKVMCFIERKNPDDPNTPITESLFTKCRVMSIGFLVVDDGSDLMDHVTEKMKTSFNVSLARTSSSKCPNVRIAFQNIAKQLVGSSADVEQLCSRSESDFSGESGDDEDSSSIGIVQGELDSRDLNLWFESKIKEGDSKVIIILDNGDRFPENVVKNLVQILDCLEFDIILLIGISYVLHSPSIFVPRSTLRMSRIAEFSLANPMERLETFLDQITLYNLDSPFHVSGEVIRIFRNYFLQQDFSIEPLLHAYHICLIEHFRKPESLFCQKDIANIWNSDSLHHLQINEITDSVSNVPGFCVIQEKVSKCLAKINSPSKNSQKRFKVEVDERTEYQEKIQEKLEDCMQKVIEWYECFVILHELGKNLPENPLGKSKYDLYISAWNGSLFEEDKESDTSFSPFEKFVNLFKNFSPPEMERRLGIAAFEIRNFHARNWSSNFIRMNMHRGLLSAICSFHNSVIDAARTDKANKTSECEPGPSKPAQKKAVTMTMAEFKQKAAEGLKKQNRDTGSFSIVREKLLTFLDVSIKVKLKNLDTFPFLEIFIFRDAGFIKKQLYPNMPKEIYLGLCVPSAYLNCECCEDTPFGSTHSNLPDTSIVYKLLLERTVHNIDLNDLFVAFKTILAPVVPKRRTATALRQSQAEGDEFLKRFAQAIAELQFLGFLKRHKGKPDEVTKLSWIYS